jgi:hypothetical protein
MTKRQKYRQHNDQKTEEQTTQGPKEEEQTTQWPKEEEQTTQWPKDRRTDNTMAKRRSTKGRSTKHTHKTKDRVTRTPLKTGGELRCSGRVGSSYLNALHHKT